MAFDVSQLQYDIISLLPSGQRYHLTEVCKSIRWEELPDEVAVRVVATFRNVQLPDGRYIHQILPLGGRLIIQYSLGTRWQDLLQTVIFTWKSRSIDAAEVNVTAYDPLIYLIKSKDDRQYPSGATGKQIIRDIAASWNIPIGKIDGPNASLPKQNFREMYLWDIINKVLTDSKDIDGERYIARINSENKLDVIKPCSNSPVYVFLGGENIIDIEDEHSIENLVTRVKVIGQYDWEKREPKVWFETGRTEFGILQELSYDKKFWQLREARGGAEQVLKERGQPSRRTIIDTWDVPTLRRGDKVRVIGGTCNGYFQVESVVHDLMDKQMNLSLVDAS